MTTPDVKPVQTKKLNPRLLPITAAILVVLALLFMATPLLRQSRAFQAGGNVVQIGGGGSLPQTVTTTQGGVNSTGRRFIVGGGAIGPVVYFIAVLISLAAALGMLFTKRWGQVLGIIMAVLYGLLGLVSLLPLLLISSQGIRNPLSLLPGIVHVVLAAAVIVLASIPAKQGTAAPVADSSASSSA